MQDQTLIVPLVAVAWPAAKAIELNRFYEALTLLLVEDYDVLILAPEAQEAQIRTQLKALSLPEDTILFLNTDLASLSIARQFYLTVGENDDGSEFVDLKPVAAEQKNTQFDLECLTDKVEFLSCEQKIFVPIYDKEFQEEQVMDISQQFPSQEVIALDCEILKSLQLKLSDLILFAND